MANGYFNHLTNVIPAGVRALAAQVNNIANEIALGFDKLPTETELKTNTTIYGGVDTGAADAYVVTLTYTPSLADGLNFFFKASNANTGASTLNLNGLGVKSILLASGAALVSGDILLNQQIWLTYESVSDSFRIMSQSSSAGGGGGNATTIALLDESADTTNFVPFAPDATGNQPLRTGTNLTFDSAAGNLAATTFTGNLSGNVTGNVTGNADTATTATSATSATSATTAGTVTTAAQPNITSVGTLTGATVSGTGSDVVDVTATGTGATGIRVSSPTASRTVPLLEIINDNSTGVGAAVSIQQDQGGPGITVAHNFGGSSGAGIDVTMTGAADGIDITANHASGTAGVFYSNASSRGFPLVTMHSDHASGSASVLEVTQDATSGRGVDVELNGAGGQALYAHSNTATRTQPLVEIYDENATGSGVALEVRANQGIAIDLTSEGTIRFPATATPSTDTNTLDDYQEGTWTPIMWDDTQSDAEGQTMSDLEATYIKIGRLVYIYCYIDIAGFGTLTQTDQAQVGNLPFDAGDDFAGTLVGGEASGLSITATSQIVGDVKHGIKTGIALSQWDATTGTSILALNEITTSGVFVLSGTYMAAN